MKRKGGGFWAGLVLVAAGLGLWAYRLLWASDNASCSVLGAKEFVPLT